MNYTYLFGGIACLIFGGWLTIHQIRIFKKGKQDRLGVDIKGLSVGTLLLILGVYLLTHL
ncbi:hypothetical protein GCM10027049_09960 [Mucilaginibacter puniceus]